jgi:transcriptional regulator GlxA family with amidase domain
MDARVQQVISLMHDDLSQDLTLCERAQDVNLTASHLCRLFKAETGVSPARYLKLLRIQKAKNLLETTFLNIKQIMNKVGVNDESHFVRDFKMIYGATPAQYRGTFRARLKREPVVISKFADNNQNQPTNTSNGQ